MTSWQRATGEEIAEIRNSSLNEYCYQCGNGISKSKATIFVLRGPVESLTELGSTFYDELRDWRNALGAEMGMSPREAGSAIASNATLKEIAMHLPVEEEGLRAIRGVGKQKMANYGSQILVMTCQQLVKVGEPQRMRTVRERAIDVQARCGTCVSVSYHPEQREQEAILSSGNFIIIDAGTGNKVSSDFTLFK